MKRITVYIPVDRGAKLSTEGIDLGYHYPESQFSPADQLHVADSAIRASSHNKVATITQSENFVLRLRRRIAETTAGYASEGLELTREDVEFVFIDESGCQHPLTLTTTGEMDPSWQITGGIFSDDFREVTAIARARFMHYDRLPVFPVDTVGYPRITLLLGENLREDLWRFRWEETSCDHLPTTGELATDYADRMIAMTRKSGTPLLVRGNNELFFMRLLRRIAESTVGDLPPENTLFLRPFDVRVIFRTKDKKEEIVPLSEDGEWPDHKALRTQWSADYQEIKKINDIRARIYRARAEKR